MIPPIQTGVQNGGVHSLGGEGDFDRRGGPTSVRSGGSARSRVPLSARSATSAISMHVNSYSYLSNRVYDFVHAKSAWLHRTQNERGGGGGADGTDAAVKRLPLDFEPFFALDTRERELESSSVTTTQQEAGSGGGIIRCLDASAFRVCFAVFSSRNWDRIYLLLGFLWSIVCPAYMDGALTVERGQLASLLLVMCAAATTPAVFAAVLKLFFAARLRSRLLHNHSNRFAGVFFVLATKAVSIPALCGGGQLCERRVHAIEGAEDQDGNDCGGPHDGEDDEENDGLCRGADERTGSERGEAERPQRGPLGGGRGGQPTALSGRDEGGGYGSRGVPDRSTNGVVGNPRSKTELDLPPRHWMCTVCKKVNMLPDEWDGRAGKHVQVVIKRKEVDKQAMYGLFKTKPGVPQCRKCHTPFNYSWRNGSGSDQSTQQRQRQLLNATLSQSKTAVSTAAGSAGPAGKRMTPSGTSETDALEGNGRLSATAFRSVLATMVGFLHRLVSPSRRRRDKSKLIDGGGRGGGYEGGPGALTEEGSKTTPAEPELWYGREFRRQLATYFKPELERPSLSSSSTRGALRISGGAGHGEHQGRYPVGARVACFAGKAVWYPGAVTASRENNTYDVRYDNGDIAQHVFPHMVRFEPIRADSRLLCRYYGLAVAAAAAWPLAGFWYFSSTTSAETTTTAGAVVALPAVAVGTVGTLAVAAQLWEIYAENTSTGLWIVVKFGTIFALPSLSLVLMGSLAFIKSLNPSSVGSWMEMLLLPSVLFSVTGGIYIHAVSPAYGKAWAVASPLWLLFLLLVALRLDGEQGDARQAFGRMRWLGVFFPLWLLWLLLIGAHHVLPYVWDIEVFRIPPPRGGVENGGKEYGENRSEAKAWLSRSRVGRLARTVVVALAASKKRREEGRASAATATAAAAAAAAAAAYVDGDGDAAGDPSTAPTATEINADDRVTPKSKNGAGDAPPSQEARLEGQEGGGRG